MYESYREAWRRDGVAETLWEGSDALVVLAPHGGDVEHNTDAVAARVHKRLRARGTTPTTWMVHGFGEDAFERHHRTSTAIDPEEFPGLATIADREFDHAVSVHRQAADHVGIGGTADRRLRERVAAHLGRRLPGPDEGDETADGDGQNGPAADDSTRDDSQGADPVPDGDGAGSGDDLAGDAAGLDGHRRDDRPDVRVDRDRMKYRGDHPDNVVNWLTADGESGLQVEATPRVANCHWYRLADAVVAAYAPLLD